MAGAGPSGCSTSSRCTADFLKVAQAYMAQGRSVIVTGDVNTSYAELDIARPKENVN